MSIANSLELGMLSLINGERAAAGLDPLRLITLLNEAAQSHSSWMLEADTFSHDGEDDSSPADRMAAAGYPFEGASVALENIGWQSARGDAGHDDDVAQIHESLMSSPGHRDNILNPEAEDIGIGIEIGTLSGENGDYEAVMVTQNFGATDADIGAGIDPGVAEPEIGDEVIPDDMIAEADEVEEPATEDDTEDEVVAEADTGEEVEDDIAVDDDTEDPAPDDEDIAMEDLPQEDLAEDLPEPDMPVLPEMPVPCGLEHFSVDLSSAFEFRKEGDQLIWETSEDKLIETFLAAFEDWAGVPDQMDDDVIDVMAEDDEASLADLLPEDMPRLPLEPAPADEMDETDDWDLVSCA